MEFYERLGFTQAHTGDVWPHPYGVLTDGRIYLGLHQARLDSPALTFVLPGLAGRLDALERSGVELAKANIGGEVFNEVGFRDPSGQPVRLLEARTFSPTGRSAPETSRCGEFGWLSLPARDLEPARSFWQSAGFVAEEVDEPYPHLRLAGEGLTLALHRPRFFAEPLLVFRAADMSARIAWLRESGAGPVEPPPRGLDAGANGVLCAPEGTALLLLRAAGPA